MRKHDIRIGISGWKYDGWRGPFYPKGLAQKKELQFASRQFNTIEINSSFYSLQEPTTYKRWYDDTPEDFVFAVKAPRFITHIKRLKNVEIPIANFFASGIFELKDKLGPILWQLPPRLVFNDDVLKEFLLLLPKDTKSAVKLARKTDRPFKRKPSFKVKKNQKLRHAIEVRHESFKDQKFINLLKAYNVAVVFAQGSREWPYIETITADFVYMRLHGDKEVYTSGYGPKALDQWAKKMKRWHRQHDIYTYFDNDVKVRAPYDAISLTERLIDFKPAVKLKKPTLKSLKQIYGPRVASSRVPRTKS